MPSPSTIMSTVREEVLRLGRAAVVVLVIVVSMLVVPSVLLVVVVALLSVVVVVRSTVEDGFETLLSLLTALVVVVVGIARVSDILMSRIDTRGACSSKVCKEYSWFSCQPSVIIIICSVAY